ncbi:MAG: hypothetical protein H7Y08_07755 [Rhizobiaceae bacterium]|nr:hypothetical protein [Rhizobiaceae bacterium]
MSKISLSVTVDEEHIGSTRQIATGLEKQGFVVERIVATAGAIFGSAELSMIDRLASFEGVQEVRPSRNYQLPPMSPNIPQ